MKDLKVIQEFFSKPIYENELDALNDKLYVDDCQIIEIKCRKMYAEKDGYIYARFEEIIEDTKEIVN